MKTCTRLKKRPAVSKRKKLNRKDRKEITTGVVHNYAPPRRKVLRIDASAALQSVLMLQPGQWIAFEGSDYRTVRNAWGMWKIGKHAETFKDMSMYKLRPSVVVVIHGKPPEPEYVNAAWVVNTGPAPRPEPKKADSALHDWARSAKAGDTIAYKSEDPTRLQCNFMSLVKNRMHPAKFTTRTLGDTMYVQCVVPVTP